MKPKLRIPFAEISFSDVLESLTDYIGNCPARYFSTFDAERLERAAKDIREKMNDYLELLRMGPCDDPH